VRESPLPFYRQDTNTPPNGIVNTVPDTIPNPLRSPIELSVPRRHRQLQRRIQWIRKSICNVIYNMNWTEPGSNIHADP